MQYLYLGIIGEIYFIMNKIMNTVKRETKSVINIPEERPIIIGEGIKEILNKYNTYTKAGIKVIYINTGDSLANAFLKVFMPELYEEFKDSEELEKAMLNSKELQENLTKEEWIDIINDSLNIAIENYIKKLYEM